MYKGKYSNKNNHRLSSWAALALALVLTLSVGGTIAYLITNTSAITNTFTPSYVDCLVDESFNGNVKTNVSVKNNGDTEAYIRATVIVTWQDAAGNVQKAPRHRYLSGHLPVGAGSSAPRGADERRRVHQQHCDAAGSDVQRIYSV